MSDDVISLIAVGSIFFVYIVSCIVCKILTYDPLSAEKELYARWMEDHWEDNHLDEEYADEYAHGSTGDWNIYRSKQLEEKRQQWLEDSRDPDDR